MTVYVDELRDGWCHMATDGDLSELHALAAKIGLKHRWFQPHRTVPHYDLVASKRRLAIKNGAEAVAAKELFVKCRVDVKE